MIAVVPAAMWPLNDCRATDSGQGNSTQPEHVIESGDAAAMKAIIVDREEFIARLPARVYVDRHDGVTAADAALFAGLETLGASAVDFRKLPAGAHPPKAMTRTPPRYPYDLRKAEAEGDARFLLFIDTDGSTAAVYCYDRTDPRFEAQAAVALQRWRFAAATINGHAVPAVIEQTIRFTIGTGGKG